jgi:hypothetical protein
MRAKNSSQPRALNLKISEVVEIKSKAEILATLDGRGELDSLPFMPEMLQFCGQRAPVYRRAIKLCDTKNLTGMHRMEETVHLEGLRCDGQAHGGCQAGCLLYWKEAWLRRVDTSEDEPTPGDVDSGWAVCTETTLTQATRATSPDGEAFSCQATELPRAAPVRVGWWNLAQYTRDVRSGNARSFAMLRSVSIMLFNKFQGANRRFLPQLRLIHGAQRYPFLAGRLTKTPKQYLNLQPGELVRVKSREEMVATLDMKSLNRGLSFDPEMLKYCGRQARVLRRVERIIDEKTGKMTHFNSDCIILEGVTCAGDYNQYCPRSIYPFWREIWLERVSLPTNAGGQ